MFFFLYLWAERERDAQRCNLVSNRAGDLSEHLLNINTHNFTFLLKLKARAWMHTHCKTCFDRGSAILLEPHLAGFYGNSRLWAEEFIRVMQTDEWTVCSICCLSRTQLSLGQRMTRGSGGVTVTMEGVWRSGCTLANYILRPPRAGFNLCFRDMSLNTDSWEDNTLGPRAAVTNNFQG